MKKNRTLCSVLLFSIFIVAEGFAFSDTKNHLYEAAIENVFEQGIVKGYEDETYRPNVSINRAEFVKILLESRFPEESRLRESVNPFCFEDLKDSIEWYSEYVCLAKDKQIISGYPDQTFRPSEFVNRAEAAKILHQLYFETVSQSSEPWYQIYLDLLEEKELLLEPLRENLEDALNRGEMAFLVDSFNAYVNNKSDQDLEVLSEDREDENGEGSSSIIKEVLEDESVALADISPFEVYEAPHPGEEIRGGYISNYNQWIKTTYEPSLSNHTLSNQEELVLQQAVIDSVNQARGEVGKVALEEDEILNDVSQQFAEHIVVNGVYSHTDMLGQDPFDRVKKGGYSGFVSESMVWRKSSVESAIDWWKNSALHWNNISNDRYTKVGVGIAKEPIGGYVVILVTGE